MSTTMCEHVRASMWEQTCASRHGSRAPSWSEVRWSTSCCDSCSRTPCASTLHTRRTRYSPASRTRSRPPAARLTSCAPASRSAPQVLPYLYVRPSLVATLERTLASSAADLQLPARARTLSAALLPPPRPAKARPDPDLDHRTRHLARTTEHWPLSWPWPWPLTLNLTADPSSEP